MPLFRNASAILMQPDRDRQVLKLPPMLHAALCRGPLDPAQKMEELAVAATVYVSMRDGVKLATDIYRAAVLPSPVIVLRTPYKRATHVHVFAHFVSAGFTVVAQDCRGTGDSEPDHWDYYMYEREDSYDCVAWIRAQDWCDGFIGGVGASYNAQMQWCMAMHPGMSAIAPEVGGFGIAFRPSRKYMFFHAYAKTVGKGDGKVAIHFYDMERQLLPETLAGGYFNDPIEPPLPASLLDQFPALVTMLPREARDWLWRHYVTLGPDDRAAFVKRALGASEVTILEIEALPRIFGQHVAHDAHTLPVLNVRTTVGKLSAPTLMITGWYDWSLNDTLESWALIQAAAPPDVARASRLIIAPSAHNSAGYHEGAPEHPELERTFRLADSPDLLIAWNEAVRQGGLDAWPKVIYYLMGANVWRTASSWPTTDARQVILFLREGGSLGVDPPVDAVASDSYVYDPADPTPTLGGSIVSGVYPPGSVDVRTAHARSDLLVFRSPVLDEPLDVVGPMRMKLFASSSAVDTDFVVRLSDVFPDGRVIQLQSALCRARYRRGGDSAELLVPGEIYEFDIDMWATANRFAAGHQLAIDISSADFPRFERNANLGGAEGKPVPAEQTIYRDRDRPSRLLLRVLAP